MDGWEWLELNQHLYCGSRGGQRPMVAAAPPHLVLSVTALFAPRSHDAGLSRLSPLLAPAIRS